MRYLLMCIGSVLAILFMVKLRKGRQYESLVIDLDNQTFPFHELYGVGFAWSAGKLLKLKEKRRAELVRQASLIYEVQYAEYYANVVWAQTVTLVHLFLTVTFLMAGSLYDSAGLVLFVGLFMSLLVGAYCLENMKQLLEKRTRECESQLPEVVSTMAVLVNSGMVLRDAWTMVARSSDGAFYQLMEKATEDMRNGLSDANAILLFGKASNSLEIKKFTSALLQSMDKGGAELSDFLAHQSTELWSVKRQRMLQGGEKAATKLLLPILLIFLGVVIIVITAAFAGSLF